MFKERKYVQVGRLQRQHIHSLSLLEHMTHKLATPKEWECIQSTGGPRSTLKMWTGPYSLWRLPGRTSSSSGFGETGHVTPTYVRVTPSIAFPSTLYVSPHC